MLPASLRRARRTGRVSTNSPGCAGLLAISLVGAFTCGAAPAASSAPGDAWILSAIASPGDRA